VLKRVGVKELTVGMFIDGFDGSWVNHSLWRTRFLIDDAASLTKVHNSGAAYCWIDTSKGSDVSPQHSASVVSTDERLPVQPDARPTVKSLADELARAAHLRHRSARVMSGVFAEARLGKAVDVGTCGSLVHEIVESVDRNPHALLSLMRLKEGGEYTYMHSVAVCALMVGLGRALGLDEDTCRKAGLAGMLHDVGKAAMPLAILNKPDRLLPEEFEVIKGHPRRGYEMLVQSGDVSEAVRDVCLHHHERMDGGGYPEGLQGAQISLLARMGAVCDVYDALTSDRPYKQGWDPAHAISQMATWEGHFDPAVLQSFVRCIGIYPIGSLVRLRSGRLAVVLEQNANTLTRPRVKVFFSTKADLPIKPQVLDLAAAGASDQIDARESPEKWQFPYLNELWGADSALANARD
jgi:putative nucleotidyltransferase with HDIG domain